MFDAELIVFESGIKLASKVLQTWANASVAFAVGVWQQRCEAEAKIQEAITQAEQREAVTLATQAQLMREAQNTQQRLRREKEQANLELEERIANSKAQMVAKERELERRAQAIETRELKAKLDISGDGEL